MSSRLRAVEGEGIGGGGRAGLEVGVKEKWEKENLRRKMVKKCTGMCEVNCSGGAGGTSCFSLW